MTNLITKEVRDEYVRVSEWFDNRDVETITSNLINSGSMEKILLLQKRLGKDHPIIIVYNGALRIESGAIVHSLLYISDSI